MDQVEGAGRRRSARIASRVAGSIGRSDQKQPYVEGRTIDRNVARRLGDTARLSAAVAATMACTA